MASRLAYTWRLAGNCLGSNTKVTCATRLVVLLVQEIGRSDSSVRGSTHDAPRTALTTRQRRTAREGVHANQSD